MGNFLSFANLKTSIYTYKYASIFKFILESKESSLFDLFKFSCHMRALFTLFHDRNTECRSKEKTLNFKVQLESTNLF